MLNIIKISLENAMGLGGRAAKSYQNRKIVSYSGLRTQNLQAGRLSWRRHPPLSQRQVGLANRSKMEEPFFTQDSELRTQDCP
jgi:hypothetical protein